MKRYVLIFAFNDEDAVLMIKKIRRPHHHIGLLNGLGGKIENGETIEEAAVREFGEEAGLAESSIQAMGVFGNMKGPSWDVSLVWIRADFPSHHHIDTEEGPVSAYNPANCTSWRSVPNIAWLVPMAYEAMNNEDFEYSETTYCN